jgi:heavy metal translocating P-type ATPase
MINLCRQLAVSAMSLATFQKFVRSLLVALPAAGLVLGLTAQLFGFASWSSSIWAIATLPVLAALLAEIVTSLRRGDVGLDIIAALAMAAALAFGEHLAAVVVALMYAGGQYLENYAEHRARREMTALLARVPRAAIRYRDGTLAEVSLDAIEPGDRLLIRRGDIVSVDGTVAAGLAVLDQSALTGESLPIQQKAGGFAMSGSTNIGEAFDLLASRTAAESTYAGIMRLVEAAQRSKAPMARLADRFAMVFLALTVLVAGVAWWLSGTPLRAVAVLVVATPCPLILAVPVAIVSGLSRAAKHGILIKGGQALEMLARVRAIVFDKTGTLTVGRARLVSTFVVPGLTEVEVLRIAASLDQASQHVIAQTIVAEARAKDLDLALPADVVETPGQGIEGSVDGRRIIVGGLHFVASKINDSISPSLRHKRGPGAVAAAVAIDGKLSGVLFLADELREGTEAFLQELRRLGIGRIVLATGDQHGVAEAISAGLSIDAVRSELTPDQKVLVVLSERKHGPIMMIGDGINDAPALAAADLGVAMGARGSAASAEAADVVLLVDHLDRILPAIKIARRSRFIALESIYVGIGLSAIAMIAAGLGYITPVQGALLQELIDVAVILNALRALYDPLHAPVALRT